MKVLYNQRLYPAGTPLVSASSRGLRYGDGLFETIRVRDGKVMLAALHFDRLFAGLHTLKFDVPSYFTPPFLEGEILRLCRENNIEALARVRLNVFRGEGSVNDELFQHPQYLVESFSLKEDFASAGNPGLDVGVFPDGRKAMDNFSSLKSNNYLLYVLAAAWAREHNLQECLVLNSDNRVAEASVHNLFFVRAGKIFTPPLSEGCVAGVMRRYLLQMLPSWGWQVSETPVSPGELALADEIFLTNAIAGIRWVRSLGAGIYSEGVSREICARLQESLR